MLDDPRMPMLPLVSIVKLDLPQLGNESIARLVKELRQRCDAKLLAEKIDTGEQLDFCKGLGFDLYQGYFFARPSVLQGKRIDNSRIALMKLLRSLSLWEKRKEQIRALSGGMKRRVLIAKALAHDPELLFLDEPTAGVDVELRRDMWRQIDRLREQGVTVILTTHYIEEAEEMADRVGVIDKGRLLLVDDKDAIMARMGRTEAHFRLAEPLSEIPGALCAYPLHLEDGGRTLTYRGGDGAGKGKAEIAAIAQALAKADIPYTGLDQKESSLEDIFVGLVEQAEQEAAA